MSSERERAALAQFKSEILACWEADQTERGAKERELAKRMCRLEGYDPDVLVMGLAVEPLRYAGRAALLEPIVPLWTRYQMLARAATETE